jgi:hypothetical protein
MSSSFVLVSSGLNIPRTDEPVYLPITQTHIGRDHLGCSTEEFNIKFYGLFHLMDEIHIKSNAKPDTTVVLAHEDTEILDFFNLTDLAVYSETDLCEVLVFFVTSEIDLSSTLNIS